MNLKFELGKYRKIVLSIALFLIFDLGVLVLNFVISSEIKNDALNVNLAGRQRMLSQRIAKVSLQIDKRLAADQPIEAAKKELSQAVNTFNRTLNAFAQGGSTLSGAGAEITIEPITTGKAQAIINEAKTYWEPLLSEANRMATMTVPAADDARRLATQAEGANLQLLRLMNDLTTDVEATAASKSTNLRMVQVGGITLATLNFAVILFHFIGQMRKSDRELEAARRETDDILRTTQEGLFLLDMGNIIGAQHSRALESILGVSQVAGHNFLEVLKPLVDEKTLKATTEYIELLQKHDVKEKLVGSLNPLNCVEITLNRGENENETRYLEFGFNRVLEQGRVTHLLVTTINITRRVRLERELKATEDKAKGQVALLVEVLSVEHDALRNFMQGAVQALNEMNRLLKEQDLARSDLTEKVHALFRLSHRIKGDAAALGLKQYAQSFHDLESMLSDMRDRAKLTGEDFLPVTVRIKALFDETEGINQAVHSISRSTIQPAASEAQATSQASTPAAELPATLRQWQQFADQVGSRHGNGADVDFHGPDPALLPENLRSAVGTIVNQFIRNAMVHGIESPQERRKAGKSERGRLVLYLAPHATGLELSFRDDGRGLSLDKLRQAAVKSGRYSPEEAAALDQRHLIGLIFEPGLSTHEQVDEDAGRGAGLDAVRDLIQRLHGNIRIGSFPGEYCLFRVSLGQPLAAA